MSKNRFACARRFFFVENIFIFNMCSASGLVLIFFESSEHHFIKKQSPPSIRAIFTMVFGLK